MELTVEEYEKALSKARRDFKSPFGKFDEYDIVHEAYGLYGNVSSLSMKKVYYDFIDSLGDTNKDISKLPSHATCKRCSPNDQLPISSFYIFTRKSGRVVIGTYCKSCENKRTNKYYKSVRHTNKFKQGHKARTDRYRKKHGERVNELYRKAEARRRKVPGYVNKQNEQRRINRRNIREIYELLLELSQ